MRKDKFDQLIESVKEGGKIVRNETMPLRKYEVQTNEIKEIRLKYNLTQDKFAELLGISTGTLKNWEQGRRKPTGPAFVLLKIVEKNPEVIFNNY